MSSLQMTSLPSLRRQNLLAEFAGLKQACPSGVFVTLTPGDPSLWSGVLFVRRGPYASAVLRFQMSFPDSYPDLPPLVTFSSDLFHPLIASLTAYMYTTDIQASGTVSATDEERLPPGGFSLRHGFPLWFGRASRNRGVSQSQPPVTTPPRGSVHITPPKGTPVASPSSAAPYMQTSGRSRLEPGHRGPAFSTYDVLCYIRSTFDDEAVLDRLPLEAAANPGAWHAWRAHRRQHGKLKSEEGREQAATGPAASTGEATASHEAAAAAATRTPGEWNWENVWEERATKGIEATLSEAVLFGGAGAADDVIRFLNMEDADVEAVKENLKRTLGAAV